MPDFLVSYLSWYFQAISHSDWVLCWLSFCTLAVAGEMQRKTIRPGRLVMHFVGLFFLWPVAVAEAIIDLFRRLTGSVVMPRLANCLLSRPKARSKASSKTRPKSRSRRKRRISS